MRRRLSREVHTRTAPERAPIALSLAHLTPGLQSGCLANFRVAKQRSGMAVAVGIFVANGSELLDQAMVRRQVADRVSGTGGGPRPRCKAWERRHNSPALPRR